MISKVQLISTLSILIVFVMLPMDLNVPVFEPSNHYFVITAV